MNRRQFLGRFFQAVISAHNSNSIYGIYHPWRQYDNLRTYVSINLKMRTGINEYYDPSITDPSDSRHYRYNYGNIPFTGNNGPIMAVYNSSDRMIYCSAYYNGSNLYNNIGNNVSLGQLSEGVYTVKCLQLGAGLLLGESGQSMTFEVKHFDRRYDIYTGAYNKYNNYGQLNNPSMYVNFMFDFEGLSFELESEYVSCGRDALGLPGISTYSYSYPSYAEVQAAYAAIGEEIDYSRYLYLLGYTENNGGLAPYETLEYYEDIYRHDSYVRITGHKGFDNTNELGRVNVSKVVDHDHAQNIWRDIAYKQYCDDNNIEFSTDLIPDDMGVFGYSVVSPDTFDGSKEIMIYDQQDYKYYNLKPTILLGRYPSVSITEGFQRDLKTICNSGYISNHRQDITIDSASKNVLVPCLRFGVTKEYDYLICDYHKGEWYPEYFSYDKPPESPEEAIRKRVDAAAELLPEARAALSAAESGEGDGVSIAHYNASESIDIPLALILGKDNIKYKVSKYNVSDCSGFEVVNTGQGIFIDLNKFPCFNQEDRRIEVREIEAGGSSVDLSGYDINGMMWSGNLLLRGTVIPLDLAEVPDHRIY